MGQSAQYRVTVIGHDRTCVVEARRPPYGGSNKRMRFVDMGPEVQNFLDPSQDRGAQFFIDMRIYFHL